MALRASGTSGAGETIRQSEIFERRIRVIDVLVPVERDGFWLGCGNASDCVPATAQRSFDVQGEGEFKVVIFVLH